MAVLERVKLERTAIVAVDELRPDVELWQAVVHAKVLDPRGEAFVQPQMRPPFLKYRKN